MTNDKVELWLATNGKYFPPERIPLIRDKMYAMDDSKYTVLTALDYKDTTVMLLVSIFLGELGVDRFLLGNIGMGVLKLLTGGLCGILWIIDIVTCMKRTREYNFNTLTPYIL